LHQISIGDMPGSSFGIARRSSARRARCAPRLGHRVRQPAGADVVDQSDRVVLAERPAAVDDLLRAALHLGLPRCTEAKSSSASLAPGTHRRGRAAAEADQHRRAAEHDDFGAPTGIALLDVLARTLPSRPRS
jgi:hypothetical protein